MAVSKGLDVALSYLDKDVEKNLPKLIEWAEKIDVQGSVKVQLDVIKRIASDPDNNWYKFALNIWRNIDLDVIKTFFTNFIVYSNIEGKPKRLEVERTHDCNIPWAILLDPTAACNLKCTGCWAADYDAKSSMDFDTLDNIVQQGKAMGTYMYLFTGGEPLVRKADVIKLCEKHNDCQFMAFTNGTLIDEDFAKEMLRVKNFIPGISIEGFEEQTDARRGKGTFQAIMRAMEILRKYKLPFGASSCYTRKNTEVIASEEFIDFLVERGCLFLWLFIYMPIGVDAVSDWLVTPEQREYMYRQIRKFRQTKPIFTMDFWNDGEYVNGCIAGGRRYCHINANGDIEPCAFIHYSDSNIHTSTLLEAYKSPLFQAYRKNQPFNCNMLRPCPLLDNPDKLVEMVVESGSFSTDMKHPEDVIDLTSKCRNAAEAWAVTADRIWKETGHDCAASS
ncbi:MAG: radical SAM protein [Clostridiales Family XIII bacterium]|nr:radical SAM protein [Clostridiales Family XIII bacterium]